MPFYFARVYQNYLQRYFQKTPVHSLTLNECSQFIGDIVDWMDIKWGEDGDCECEVNPKSNIRTYTKFPPKMTDITRIGHWLRQYMLLDNIVEDDRFHSNNIVNIIFENCCENTIQKLFLSLNTEDQREFMNDIPMLATILGYNDRENIPQYSETYIVDPLNDERYYEDTDIEDTDIEDTDIDMPDLMEDEIEEGEIEEGEIEEGEIEEDEIEEGEILTPITIDENRYEDHFDDIVSDLLDPDFQDLINHPNITVFRGEQPPQQLYSGW